jgi:hypothetical protein
MKKIQILVGIVLTGFLFSCSKEDKNGNGILGPDDKVLVRMNINGQLWESRKNVGTASVTSGGQLYISAEHENGSALLVTVNGVTAPGNFSLTAPSNVFQYNGSFNIGSTVTGTSGNLNVDELKDMPSVKSARGTFSGTAKNPLNDSTIVITEGEFWGSGF